MEIGMAKIGGFTFVLHSHIPYTRQAGRWPHGEEWLHEAAAETYVPLLNQLYDLKEQSIPARLTIGLTPVLVEQLADNDIRSNFLTYLDDRILAAREDIPRFKDENNAHFTYLAQYYLDWYEHIRHSYTDRFEGDIIGAFRTLQDEGMIEIVTSAATHGYLPLLDRDGSVHLQLKTAVESYKLHFGKAPASIWLPECAYRPGYIAADGRTREGIENFLERLNLDLFFAETHMIEGGRPVGVAAGEAIGPYGAIMRRYLVPFNDSAPEQPATTYLPYFVTRPKVAVIGRNNRTGLQVWSADWGYPGEFDYRDFHKKDGTSGLQYWRVSGAKVDLAEKDVYHPDWAASKVAQHIEHYARLVEDLVQKYHDENNAYGFISANYDTELFGHWWFEGVDWLGGVLGRLAQSSIVDLTSASSFLSEHPPDTVLNLPEGSWGAGGTHFVWDNVDTHWVWPLIHAAEEKMGQLVKKNAAPEENTRLVLNQAARELLLLQSSDWPFLITTGQAKEYAIQRFQQHLDRFNLLLDSVLDNHPNTAAAHQLWEKDKVFPKIDYRWFTE
jgi:1,4-alpha-glucan branching enzyme